MLQHKYLITGSLARFCDVRWHSVKMWITMQSEKFRIKMKKYEYENVYW